MPQLLDSDDADGDHHSTTQDSNEGTTSSQRKFRNEGISEGAKRRVDTAASHPSLSGKRCMILNVEEINLVEYAHCLPRSTKDSILDSLEFAWNMKWGTLNVDSHYNIFRLNAIWHDLFDRGKWLLVPEPDIVQQYHNAMGDRISFPHIDSPTYTYRLLAVSEMRPVPVYRQGPIETRQRDLLASDFTFFSHPYTDFVVLSHVHPRYVICNAGQKLGTSDTLVDLKHSYPQYSGLLEQIKYIYDTWTTAVSKEDHPDFFLDDDDDSGGE